MNTQVLPKALIAEDDRVLADILRLALVRAGFEVTVAHDGQRALSLARNITFRAIVSDFQMPRLNGEAFLSSVRFEGASRDAILVMCSAKGYELDLERLKPELGLATILYKPFSLAELVQVLKQSCSPDSTAIPQNT